MVLRTKTVAVAVDRKAVGAVAVQTKTVVAVVGRKAVGVAAVLQTKTAAVVAVDRKAVGAVAVQTKTAAVAAAVVPVAFRTKTVLVALAGAELWIPPACCLQSKILHFQVKVGRYISSPLCPRLFISPIFQF